ncbi:MAG TPA: hypothetical protein VK968_06855, partial [Roseimicrobium sp.]|nr:hypothetical protein [Roseimicrobium sp.]
MIITITLLAFLVLLLVSLASLTRVETQVASNGQQMSKARQNALLALNIALGQLQKTVGPDQRVTATADIAGDRLGARLTTGAPATNTHGAAAPDGSRAAVANGLAGAGPGTRYWTGAWGNFDPPSAIYQQTPAPVLLNWLVSGNENASAFTTDPSTGRITSPSVTASFRPEMIINNLDTGTTALSTNLSVNSHPAVLLIGPNT